MGLMCAKNVRKRAVAFAQECCEESDKCVVRSDNTTREKRPTGLTNKSRSPKIVHGSGR